MFAYETTIFLMFRLFKKNVRTAYFDVTMRCNAYAPVSKLLQKTTVGFAINSGYIYIVTQLYVAMCLRAVEEPFLATTKLRHCLPIFLCCLINYIILLSYVAASRVVGEDG